MSEIKKYLVTIGVALAIVIAVDFGVGKCLEYFYKTQTSGLLYRTSYAMEETNADVLIFGASRANRHYDIKTIESLLGVSAYNTGRDGNFIFYQTAVLRSVLARYKPKRIILDFTGSFEFLQSDYDRLSALLPYYGNHKEIRDLILLKSKFEKYKILCQSYRYNSLLTTIAIGNTEYNKSRKSNKGSYKGFVPVHGVYEGKLDSIEFPTNYSIDSTKLRVFEEFLRLTSEENIPVLVVNSPVYYLYGQDYSIEICRQLCEENGIDFIDYSKDERFLANKNLFRDQHHLNAQGALNFTQDIVGALNQQTVDSLID